MNEEQTSYKVTDRRLFNPDGTPRDVPENERPEPTPAKPEAATAAASSPPEPPVAEPPAASSLPSLKRRSSSQRAKIQPASDRFRGGARKLTCRTPMIRQVSPAS